VEHIGVPRLILATFFLGFGLYMTPTLWGRTPQGVAGRFLLGFAPLNTAELPGQGQAAGLEKLDWYLDYEQARAKALEENKLLFIDFTGVNCQNCRANEMSVFLQPAVREQLKGFVRVQLYTDSVPNPKLTAAAAKSEADRNSTRESETFHEISTPLYVIFQPDRNRAEENGKLLGIERSRAAGYIKDVSSFVDMLEKAQKTKLDHCEGSSGDDLVPSVAVNTATR
jgi:thiol:disulfide interchange protein DsbD